MGDLLYRWAHSSDRRKVKLQQDITEEYENGSFRERSCMRSRVREYYEHSGEGLTFYESLLGLEQLLKEK